MPIRFWSAFARSIPAGLVWGVGSACVRWDLEPHRKLVLNGVIFGLSAFGVTLVLTFFFPTIGGRASPRN